MSDHLLPYLANCSLLFTEEPLLRRPAAARAAGFGAVEFWWPFAVPVPSDREVDAFTTAIEEAGVALAGLNFFAGELAGPGRGGGGEHRAGGEGGGLLRRHGADRAGERAEALSAAHRRGRGGRGPAGPGRGRRQRRPPVPP